MSPAAQPGKKRPSPSVARHRREAFWQITLPILLFVLVLLAALALILLSGLPAISGAADLSLALVSLPFLVLGVLVVGLIVALALGAGWLIWKIPQYTHYPQDAAARVSDIVQKAMQRVTNAIIPAIAGFSTARNLLNKNRAGGSDDSQPGSPPKS